MSTLAPHAQSLASHVHSFQSPDLPYASTGLSYAWPALPEPLTALSYAWPVLPHASPVLLYALTVGPFGGNVLPYGGNVLPQKVNVLSGCHLAVGKALKAPYRGRRLSQARPPCGPRPRARELFHKVRYTPCKSSVISLQSSVRERAGNQPMTDDR